MTATVSVQIDGEWVELGKAGSAKVEEARFPLFVPRLHASPIVIAQVR